MCGGYHGRLGATRGGLAPCRGYVGNRERDVADPVTVLAHVLGDLPVRSERCGQHDPDVVLLHDVAGPIADPGLEAAEGDRREAPQGTEVGGCLAGVADPELDVVDAVEGQEVLGLVERAAVDPRAGLVGVVGGDGRVVAGR